MFFRRYPRLMRTTASLLLLETLLQSLSPVLAMATMGPTQPEFTSYESPGATDMVSLATGDMTYQIPLFEVPGPERSCALPLTYRAGIRAEQEASWVGLGWTLNPGAIARSISGYPDDADGEFNTNTFQKDLNRGWTTNGGILGILNLGWDSETGHHGSVDLLGLASVGWKGGRVNSGDLVGIGVTRGEGVSVDPVRLTMAAVTVASFGTTAAASGAMAAAKQAAWGAVISAGVGLAVNSISLGRTGTFSGNGLTVTTRTQRHLFHTDYSNEINDNKTELMYGSLNFDRMSQQVSYDPNENFGPAVRENSTATTSHQPGLFNFNDRYNTNSNNGYVGSYHIGIAGDVQQYGAPNDSYRQSRHRPLSLAHDNYSVMGEGISGTMRPFRLETGTVPYPQQAARLHRKFNTIPFCGDYKPQFRYEGALQNEYDYHRPQAAAGTNATGVEVDVAGGKLTLTDPTLAGASDISPAATRTAPTRPGFVINSPTEGRRVVQGRHVAWYTNEEIARRFDDAGSAGTLPGFLEFQTPVMVNMRTEKLEYYGLNSASSQLSGRYWEPVTTVVQDAQRRQYEFRAKLPPKGIGAFAVTSEDGTTYHYSLPVYQYTQIGYMHDRNDASTLATQMMGSRTGRQPFAVTWLLTAVTSPDYVDRGTLGILDAEDWGGWVRYNYGRFASQYKWRQPYVGELPEPENDNNVGVSEGYKETYYLNSISTRSHTALFIKSVRRDGRGHFVRARQAHNSSLGIDESAPSSSLRLDEIVLLTDADAKRLRSTDGIRQSGAAPIPALLPNTGPAVGPTTELRHGDTYENVYDTHDLAADPRYGEFIRQNAIKRVHFNYTYELGQAVPNSFAKIQSLPDIQGTWNRVNHDGRLTLKSVSMFGPGGEKLSPDFIFDYSTNPAYSINKWDGFGMYASGGTSAANSHRPSQTATTANTDGAAWSLTQITNPLGSKTRIRYERDTYANVSGIPLILSFKAETAGDPYMEVNRAAGFTGDLRNFIHPGDAFMVNGTCSSTYMCDDTDPGNPGSTVGTSYPCSSNFSQQVIVDDVLEDYIILTASSVPTLNTSNCSPQGRIVEIISNGYYFDLTFTAENKFGGELRVAEVETEDEPGIYYKVRYGYNSEAQTGENSTGVLSQEPVFVRAAEVRLPSFYKLFDYPSTPVIYGQVNVRRGTFLNGDDDYETRENYAFHTPHSGMVSAQSATSQLDGMYPYDGWWIYSLFFRNNNNIVVNTGLIGQVAKLEKRNRANVTEFSTAFNYGTPMVSGGAIANLGRFTESVMTSDLVMDSRYLSSTLDYALNRTTKTYHSLALLSTTTTANGIQVRTENELFDPYSGQVVSSLSRNSLGSTYRTVLTPAYTLYPEMGPRSASPTQRNMLTQLAGTTLTREHNGQSAVMSASTTTWKPDWVYRGFDPTSGNYITLPSAQPPTWRTNETWQWIGLATAPSGHLLATTAPGLLGGRQPDGALVGFSPFSWLAPTATNEAAGWLRTGQVTRYDAYSGTQEVVGVDGLPSAQKTGYNNLLPIVIASNARYTEIAFSGAEDLLRFDAAGLRTHFGGEVQDGALQSDRFAHTGRFSSMMSTGVDRAFRYRAIIGNDQDLRTDRNYRLSVWVHKSDVGANAKLYAEIDNNQIAITDIRGAQTRKSGDWYQLNLTFRLPATATGKTLTVGCLYFFSPNAVYVDDFRFQPVDAEVTAYVYDPLTQRVTETLDNDNFYTRQTYDVAGRPKQVFREVVDRPETPSAPAARLLKSYRYNLKRASEATWIGTGRTNCQTNANGPTGIEEVEEIDQNLQSPTYGQPRWQVRGPSSNCRPCQGRERWMSGLGVCDEPVIINTDCSCASGMNICRTTFTLRYSDGQIITEYVFDDACVTELP